MRLDRLVLARHSYLGNFWPMVLLCFPSGQFCCVAHTTWLPLVGPGFSPAGTSAREEGAFRVCVRTPGLAGHGSCGELRRSFTTERTESTEKMRSERGGFPRTAELLTFRILSSHTHSFSS